MFNHSIRLTNTRCSILSCADHDLDKARLINHLAEEENEPLSRVDRGHLIVYDPLLMKTLNPSN
jgi:hypothetical protein